METNDVNELKKNQLFESHELNNDDFDVAYLISSFNNTLIMRNLNDNGRKTSYTLVNLDNYFSEFETDSEYLMMIKDYRKLGNEYGLEDTPRINGIQNLSNGNFQKTAINWLEQLKNNRTVFEVIFMNEENTETSLWGLVKEIDADNEALEIEVLNDEDIFDRGLNTNETVHLYNIVSLSFNSWESIFDSKIVQSY